MIRYYIFDGDKTTTGGTVNATSGFGTNMGRNRAMEGDPVSCPTCKTIGYIVCDGPRHNVTIMKKRPALNDDLCACACESKPKLIHSLSNMSETMSGEAVVGQGYGSWLGLKDQVAPDPSVGRKFLFTDSETGEPLANREYVALVNGQTKKGMTDGAGYAHVDAKPGSEVSVHLVFNSPKTQLTHSKI
ncbi:PAAR domain-containing protein [Robbsia andropogonis]|uniref:PAAR domain-containing protein n=1 Tax=Robbsia andropogonis TaxID=28092 RepID=UPI00209CA6F8|nr:PAAR domain-containing protein [Robbsia andropogonis]MCP1116927.1 PAAR domain-containing protein [Robbsia andropogonis]MCP1126394.1 PAAR domain-containing protein [Robbsia andropogonis]